MNFYFGEKDRKTQVTMASNDVEAVVNKEEKDEKEVKKSEAKPKKNETATASEEEIAGQHQPTTTESIASVTDHDTEEEEDDESDKKRRVYVGNLAWEVSWQDLKDLMKKTNHEVLRVDVMQTSDGRSKGCAIVEFATPEGATEAVLNLNDAELSGRRIFVREDRENLTNVNVRDHHSSRGGGGGRYVNNRNRQSGGGVNNNNSTIQPNPESQSRRVYVGNLSWDVTWPELKDHMRSAGEVLRADVISEHNGRSKGCGIVEYATEDEARQAIANLTHTELRGRTIFVREDREGGSSGEGGGHRTQAASGSGGNNNSTSVYVWNLSYDVSWQDLKDHMRKAGNVDQSTILTGNDGSSIGCGIVVYQSARDAQRAIRELQESDLKGRPVRLREDRIGGGSGGGGRSSGGKGSHGGRGGRGSRGKSSSHHNSGESVPEGTQLYVGNLSYDTSWRDLKDHFNQIGEVVRADVKTSDNGRSKGFGIVRFARREDAESAISSLGGVELDGRPLEVRLDLKA